MDLVQLISIVLEVVVTIIAIMAGLRGRTYAFGFALTYALYTFYDLSKLYDWAIPSGPITTIFLVATLSALWGIWGMYTASDK